MEGGHRRSSLPLLLPPRLASPTCYLRIFASALVTSTPAPAAAGPSPARVRGTAQASIQRFPPPHAMATSTGSTSGQMHQPIKGVSDLLVWHPGNKGGWVREAGVAGGVTRGVPLRVNGERQQQMAWAPPIGGGAAGGGGGVGGGEGAYGQAVRGEGGRGRGVIATPQWPPPKSLAPPFLAVVRSGSSNASWFRILCRAPSLGLTCSPLEATNASTSPVGSVCIPSIVLLLKSYRRKHRCHSCRLYAPVLSEEYSPDDVGGGWSVNYNLRDLHTPDRIDVYQAKENGGPSAGDSRGGTLGVHSRRSQQHAQRLPLGMGAGAVVLVREAMRCVSASTGVYLKLTPQSRGEVRVPAQPTLTVVPWVAGRSRGTWGAGAAGAKSAAAARGDDGNYGAAGATRRMTSPRHLPPPWDRVSELEAIPPQPPRMVLPLEQPRRVTLSEVTRRGLNARYTL